MRRMSLPAQNVPMNADRNPVASASPHSTTATAPRKSTPQTLSPTGAGPALAVIQLLLAAREGEPGGADAETSERGGFEDS